MELKTETSGKLTIVQLEGRLDTSNYMEFEKKLLEAVNEIEVILLDCSGLNYISSSGLRTLLLALKKAEASGHSLALSNLQPNIMEIFKISAFINLFKVFPTREEAVSALA